MQPADLFSVLCVQILVLCLRHYEVCFQMAVYLSLLGRHSDRGENLLSNLLSIWPKRIGLGQNRKCGISPDCPLGVEGTSGLESSSRVSQDVHYQEAGWEVEWLEFKPGTLIIDMHCKWQFNQLYHSTL